MDKTLSKGLRVLELLVAQGSGHLGEIAAAAGLSKSNAHRTLQTLVAHGYVTQDESDGRYGCSLKLLEMSGRLVERFDVRTIAAAPMQALAEKSRETVNLVIRDGLEVVYIEKIDSPQPILTYSRAGGRAPAHCVASGKALLASAGPEAWAALPATLERFTPHTICKRSALIKELERTRERGYGVNHEEWRLGVSGLGAVVLDVTGSAVAAIGISAPTSRLGSAREKQLGRFLVDTVVAVASTVKGLPIRPGAKSTP